MTKLLSTTALVLALGLPTLVTAQTATDTTATDTTSTMPAAAEMPGFLASRAQTDIFASELIGHDVYARRTDAAATTDAQATTDGAAATTTTGDVAADTATDATMSSDMSTMARADLDMMDNIGQITEVVLSHDGQVRALVIGVGGFLGMGEQDVAVTMDQITFASDPDDANEMYVVVNTTAEMLKTSPAYQRDMMSGAAVMEDTTGTDAQMATDAQAGMEAGAATNPGDRTAFVAPMMEREGYTQMKVTEVSSEMLVGKTVYGVNDDSVGTIDDLLLDENGAISNVIIDFGGFLGMGTSQVSVGYDELTILADGNQADVRVYIEATKEQVQAQPVYEASN